MSDLLRERVYLQKLYRLAGLRSRLSERQSEQVDNNPQKQYTVYEQIFRPLKGQIGLHDEREANIATPLLEDFYSVHQTHRPGYSASQSYQRTGTNTLPTGINATPQSNIMASRLPLACNPCRTKKQKCSGTYPSCLQCSASSLDCTWAARKQRGPSKGYIEGLEARLRETEQLLLQLLPVVTDEQLIAATEDIDVDSGAIGMGRDDGKVIKGSTRWAAAPPDLKNNVSLEYWERHPIGNLDEIRAWQRSCVLGHGLMMASARKVALGEGQASQRNGGQARQDNSRPRKSSDVQDEDTVTSQQISSNEGMWDVKYNQGAEMATRNPGGISLDNQQQFFWQ